MIREGFAIPKVRIDQSPMLLAVILEIGVKAWAKKAQP
jgi:hypothetical protein